MTQHFLAGYLRQYANEQGTSMIEGDTEEERAFRAIEGLKYTLALSLAIPTGRDSEKGFITAYIGGVVEASSTDQYSLFNALLEETADEFSEAASNMEKRADYVGKYFLSNLL